MDAKILYLTKNGLINEGNFKEFKQASDKAIAGKNLNTKENKIIVDMYADMMTRMCNDNNMYSSFKRSYKEKSNTGDNK